MIPFGTQITNQFSIWLWHLFKYQWTNTLRLTGYGVFQNATDIENAYIGS